ncbi:MAG: TlpA family protein disulfide reductase [Bacteroidetes bacterium]|jgi:thiol-disulfide isomerase/thioredoxin|nr:TlpA family protein disulfide reductase [Bacteroidota bacterium]
MRADPLKIKLVLSLILYLFIWCTGINTVTAQSVFKIPSFTGKTLDNKPVDSLYFKDKLTLISFFYIGCAPCMREIPVLNRLQKHYAGKPVQLLAIGSHPPAQLAVFDPGDSSNTEIISRYRTEKIHYDILPECTDESTSGNASRCFTLSRLFGVNAYPTSFIINGRGEILMTTEGFPMRENAEETFQEMVKMVDGYLK